jgi:hypothetical protein
MQLSSHCSSPFIANDKTYDLLHYSITYLEIPKFYFSMDLKSRIISLQPAVNPSKQRTRKGCILGFERFMKRNQGQIPFLQNFPMATTDWNHL